MKLVIATAVFLMLAILWIIGRQDMLNDVPNTDPCSGEHSGMNSDVCAEIQEEWESGQ